MEQITIGSTRTSCRRRSRSSTNTSSGSARGGSRPTGPATPRCELMAGADVGGRGPTGLGVPWPSQHLVGRSQRDYPGPLRLPSRTRPTSGSPPRHENRSATSPCPCCSTSCSESASPRLVSTNRARRRPLSQRAPSWSSRVSEAGVQAPMFEDPTADSAKVPQPSGPGSLPRGGTPPPLDEGDRPAGTHTFAPLRQHQDRACRLRQVPSPWLQLPASQPPCGPCRRLGSWRVGHGRAGLQSIGRTGRPRRVPSPSSFENCEMLPSQSPPGLGPIPFS